MHGAGLGSGANRVHIWSSLCVTKYHVLLGTPFMGGEEGKVSGSLSPSDSDGFLTHEWQIRVRPVALGCLPLRNPGQVSVLGRA